MENTTKRITVTDVLFIIISIVFTVGMCTFLEPCGPKDDGSFMACHWAGKALFGLGIVLSIQAVLHVVTKNSYIKKGLSIGMIPTALLVIYLPKNLINLCMMNHMRCHSVMHPGAVIFGIVIVVIAIIDIFVVNRNKDKSHKEV